MADVSKVIVDGVTYKFKDEEARGRITDLEDNGSIVVQITLQDGHYKADMAFSDVLAAVKSKRVVFFKVGTFYLPVNYRSSSYITGETTQTTSTGWASYRTDLKSDESVSVKQINFKLEPSSYNVWD